jgi:hypothetical protein
MTVDEPPTDEGDVDIEDDSPHPIVSERTPRTTSQGLRLGYLDRALGWLPVSRGALCAPRTAMRLTARARFTQGAAQRSTKRVGVMARRLECNLSAMSISPRNRTCPARPSPAGDGCDSSATPITSSIARPWWLFRIVCVSARVECENHAVWQIHKGGHDRRVCLARSVGGKNFAAQRVVARCRIVADVALTSGPQ